MVLFAEVDTFTFADLAGHFHPVPPKQALCRSCMYTESSHFKAFALSHNNTRDQPLSERSGGSVTLQSQFPNDLSEHFGMPVILAIVALASCIQQSCHPSSNNHHYKSARRDGLYLYPLSITKIVDILYVHVNVFNVTQLLHLFQSLPHKFISDVVI